MQKSSWDGPLTGRQLVKTIVALLVLVVVVVVVVHTIRHNNAVSDCAASAPATYTLADCEQNPNGWK